MTDFAPVDVSGVQSADATAPTITVHSGYIVTGTGFLSHRPLTIRVTYIAEEVSDDLAFSTDVRGQFYAEVPTSPTSGVMHVSATDHRADPDGAGGLLWSNTEILAAGEVF